MSCVVLSGAVVGNVEKHGCRCTRKRNVPFSCVTAPSTCLSGEPSVHFDYTKVFISYRKYCTAHIFSYIWRNNVLYCTGRMVIHTVHTLPRGTQVLPVLTLAFPFLSRYRQGPRRGSRSLVPFPSPVCRDIIPGSRRSGTGRGEAIRYGGLEGLVRGERQ